MAKLDLSTGEVEGGPQSPTTKPSDTMSSPAMLGMYSSGYMVDRRPTPGAGVLRYPDDTETDYLATHHENAFYPGSGITMVMPDYTNSQNYSTHNTNRYGRGSSSVNTWQEHGEIFNTTFPHNVNQASYALGLDQNQTPTFARPANYVEKDPTLDTSYASLEAADKALEIGPEATAKALIEQYQKDGETNTTVDTLLGSFTGSAVPAKDSAVIKEYAEAVAKEAEPQRRFRQAYDAAIGNETVTDEANIEAYSGAYGLDVAGGLTVRGDDGGLSKPVDPNEFAKAQLAAEKETGIQSPDIAFLRNANQDGFGSRDGDSIWSDINHTNKDYVEAYDRAKRVERRKAARDGTGPKTKTQEDREERQAAVQKLREKRFANPDDIQAAQAFMEKQRDFFIPTRTYQSGEGQRTVMTNLGGGGGDGRHSRGGQSGGGHQQPDAAASNVVNDSMKLYVESLQAANEAMAGALQSAVGRLKTIEKAMRNLQ